MGCGNSQETATTKAIEVKMKQHVATDRQIKKLLLLGPGSSGKTTIFKQVRQIWGTEQEAELTESLHIIRQNCVSGILILLKKSDELYALSPERYAACQLSDQAKQEIAREFEIVSNFGGESFAEPLEAMETLGEAIAKIWSLPSVRATFDNRGGKFSFPDNMDFFFDKVTAVMADAYIPNQEDLLKVRARTTGIVEYKFDMNEHKFQIFDVGGQRNERKKWIHAFDNVTAVLFVIALNHYHAVLFEDEKKNALHEALDLFAEICNSKWFRQSEMILFMNKDDLFRDKLREEVPLSVCFNQRAGWSGDEWAGFDFRASGDAAADAVNFERAYKEATDFVQQQFLKQNKNPHKAIFAHITMATDQNNVEKVFWDVQNIVIRSNLQKGGLML